MAILLIIAALILIGVVILIIKTSGRSGATAPPGRDRFRSVGPGEAKPKEHRATGLD